MRGKYLKALLVHHGIAFPKTHDIEELVRLLPAPALVSLTVKEQGDLTDYATGARYPGWGDVSLREARSAVEVARRIRAEIQALLPSSG
jgi:HEPN domain-containing protein